MHTNFTALHYYILGYNCFILESIFCMDNSPEQFYDYLFLYFLTSYGRNDELRFSISKRKVCVRWNDCKASLSKPILWIVMYP